MISIYIQKRAEGCRKKKRAARRSILRYIPINTLADFHNVLFSFCMRKREAAMRTKKYMLRYKTIDTLADFRNILFNFCRKKKKEARRSMLCYIPIDTLADFDYFISILNYFLKFI